MSTLDFVLEIGVEEIPDWMIVPYGLEEGLKDVRARINALGGKVEWCDGTPRRLSLFASGLPAIQQPQPQVVTGPPVAAGAQARQKFAAKLGISQANLVEVDTPKGLYLQGTFQQQSQATEQVLADWLPGDLNLFFWPKMMHWHWPDRSQSNVFIRPVRWVCAVLGSNLVKFRFMGVDSSTWSSGHRRFGQRQIFITPSTYTEQLRDNYVLVRAEGRRQRIKEGIAALLSKGLRLKEDAGLLETLTYLTEWPTPILGSFDPSYLELPSEVLVTVMRYHQKYFSVLNEDGSLAPHFIAVLNTTGDPDGLIVSGNERVLRARFNDARFFWNVDQQKKLRDRVEDLKAVTYQKELGSYHDKMDAMLEILAELKAPAAAFEAARLCKCDLTCEMVKEFTELQGQVGGLYAKAQGESEEVATAIYDHYKPVSMEDSIPRTDAGRYLGLADKLHALRGCFRIGLIPSGSKDPLALRRAAQGVVKILTEGGLQIPYAALAAGDAKLHEFLIDRLSYYFREVRGFKYDEVKAVLTAGVNTLPDVLARLEAIQAVRPTQDFEPLAASFKRIRNIVEQAGGAAAGAVDPSLFREDPERQLHEAMTGLNLAGLDHRTSLERIATLRPAVDAFFDKVLVNAPEPEVRANRLALLQRILTEFSTIADFSEIVTTS